MVKLNVHFYFNILVLLLFCLISKISCDINIHVIPHTHLDPGWLKTPEEYYTTEMIEDIFNTVLSELTKDPQKTFVINELYYFKIWYLGISNDKQNKFKELIKEKRIEFVSGSYIINDEATPLYYNIADQIRIGHQFLLEEFGVVPKTGWYIDSFGHSAGNAHVLSQLNFENLVLGRMHLDFLELMKREKKLEFYWEPFDSVNSNKKILTQVLALHYGYDLYFQDLGFENEEFKRNMRNTIEVLITNLKEIKRGVKHSHILYLFGDDFRYKDNNLFLNMDSIIRAFQNNNNDNANNNANGNVHDNARDNEVIGQQVIRNKFDDQGNINIFYSTPENYFNSIRKELEKNKINLDIYKNKDFYPLRADCYWTGFFTSKPYLKGYIRKASNIFHTLSKYHSYNRFLNNNINYDTIFNLNTLREVVGLTQHHDAITGTCMQYVATDYIDRLKKGIKNAEIDFIKDFETKYKETIGKVCYNNYITDENNCANEFQILPNSKDKEIKIGIYNPKFSSISSNGANTLLINIEILNSEYEYKIEEKKSDFFCIDEKSIEQAELYQYSNKCFLQFFYDFKEEEELAIVTLKQSDKIKKERYNKIDSNNTEKIEITKDHVNIKSLLFSPNNYEFDLEYINEDGKINKVLFTYYDGMYYVNSGDCLDGAYIFSPYNNYPDEIAIDYNNSFYYRGGLGVTFVTRNIMASFTIFTIFYDPFFVKVQHIFDALDKSYFLKRFSFGYSFTLRTNINNKDKDNKPIFYTDANGLEVIKRTIDKFDYQETGSPSTGGNFYPVTSFISIQDENTKSENKNKVTIFNDRAQGGTGFLPGSIILILQRMSYGSDNKGLIENMYETESMNTNTFTTTHLIVFGTKINKYQKENNNNFKYMMQKTDTINFVYNYLNVATLLFKLNSSNILEYAQKANMNNELIKTEINKYLLISPDIRANYEVIKNNLIIGIYFRYNNYFFNMDDNEYKHKSFGKISLNFNEDPKFKIYYDKTGINYFTKNEEIFGLAFKNKLMEPKDISLTLENNEFLYIYYYFGK